MRCGVCVLRSAARERGLLTRFTRENHFTAGYYNINVYIICSGQLLFSKVCERRERRDLHIVRLILRSVCTRIRDGLRFATAAQENIIIIIIILRSKLNGDFLSPADKILAVVQYARFVFLLARAQLARRKPHKALPQPLPCP